jgi:hypothetical protein
LTEFHRFSPVELLRIALADLEASPPANVPMAPAGAATGRYEYVSGGAFGDADDGGREMLRVTVEVTPRVAP